jgi:hypothetical protein
MPPPEEEIVLQRASSPVPAPAPSTVAPAAPGTVPGMRRAQPVGRAAGLEGPGLKKLTVDVLITALELSKLPGFSDSDTLRYLLDSWFHEYHKNRTIDLSLLWNTLLSEEGVTLDMAGVPLMILDLTRPVHGFSVVLPEGLRDNAGLNRIKQAAAQRLREAGGFTRQLAEVEARKRQSEAPPEAQKPEPRALPKPAKPDKPEAKVSGRPTGLETSPRVRRIRAVVLAVVGLAALTWGMLRAYQLRASDIDLSAEHQVLRLERGIHKGSVLSAVVADPRWDSMGMEEQRATLGRLAEVLGARGIDTVLLTNRAGVPLASLLPPKKGEQDVRIRVGHEVFGRESR